MDKKIEYLAKQVRRVLQLYAQSISDESQMMEIADIYPSYEVGRAYHAGEIFGYGVNSDNETQLYKVLQDHTSASQWKPDEAVSLYKKIGVTPSGYPIWTQPYGAGDAYQKDDIVQHNGRLWINLIANNVWEPGSVGTESLWAEFTE